MNAEIREYSCRKSKAQVHKSCKGKMSDHADVFEISHTQICGSLGSKAHVPCA